MKELVFALVSVCIMASCGNSVDVVLVPNEVLRFPLPGLSEEKAAAVYEDSYLYWAIDDTIGEHLAAVSLETGDLIWQLPFSYESYGGMIEVSDTYAVISDGSEGGAVIDLEIQQVTHSIDDFLLPTSYLIWGDQLCYHTHTDDGSTNLVSREMVEADVVQIRTIATEADKAVLFSRPLKLMNPTWEAEYYVKVIREVEHENDSLTWIASFDRYNEQGVLEQSYVLGVEAVRDELRHPVVLDDNLVFVSDRVSPLRPRLLTSVNNQIVDMNLESGEIDRGAGLPTFGIMRQIGPANSLVVLGFNRWAEVDTRDKSFFTQKEGFPSINPLAPIYASFEYSLLTALTGELIAIPLSPAEHQILRFEEDTELLPMPVYVEDREIWVAHSRDEILGFTIERELGDSFCC